MARGNQDQQLTQAEIEHLSAQDRALAQAAQQEAARTAIAQQEQGTRAAAQQQAAAESQAKIAQEREMTPFQKMLQLSQAGTPALQERANKIRAAIDLYQTMAQGKLGREQIQSQQQIEAGREKGALERQQEVSKSNTVDSMLSHLAMNPDAVGGAAVFREALKRAGSPALAEAYDKVREPIVASQVKENIARLPAIQKAGQLSKVLDEIKDPDVRDQVRPHVERMMKEPIPVAPEVQYPGYGSGVSQDIKYAPIDLVNLISTVANKTVVPELNTYGSIVGAPPIERARILPRDYQKAWEVLNQ